MCHFRVTSFGAPTLDCRDVVEYEELMPDQLCVAWHLCGEGAGNICGDHGALLDKHFYKQMQIIVK